MRATIFILISFLFLGLFLWTTLSGALLVVSSLFFFISIIGAIGYSDTAILFFLGARFVRSGDESHFYEAADQEAYKLSVSIPDLYFYNGGLERGFVLQNRKTVSLVLSRSLLEQSSPEELSGICFELLLQVKKGMASKRTKSMFIIGAISWVCRSITHLFCSLIPIKEVNVAMGWILAYFLHPWLHILFRMTLGKTYFKRLEALMQEYPDENQSLKRVGLKLRKSFEIDSLPSKKLLEFASISRSRHFQNILTLELLPHEWDFFFNSQEITRAQEI